MLLPIILACHLAERVLNRLLERKIPEQFAEPWIGRGAEQLQCCPLTLLPWYCPPVLSTSERQSKDQLEGLSILESLTEPCIDDRAGCMLGEAGAPALQRRPSLESAAACDPLRQLHGLLKGHQLSTSPAVCSAVRMRGLPSTAELRRRFVAPVQHHHVIADDRMPPVHMMTCSSFIPGNRQVLLGQRKDQTAK